MWAVLWFTASRWGSVTRCSEPGKGFPCFIHSQKLFSYSRSNDLFNWWSLTIRMGLLILAAECQVICIHDLCQPVMWSCCYVRTPIHRRIACYRTHRARSIAQSRCDRAILFCSLSGRQPELHNNTFGCSTRVRALQTSCSFPQTGNIYMYEHAPLLRPASYSAFYHGVISSPPSSGLLFPLQSLPFTRMNWKVRNLKCNAHN
jgi:hypothetical protein